LPQEHEWWGYINRVDALLQSVDRLIAAGAADEAEAEA
jgi:hypothetical protein